MSECPDSDKQNVVRAFIHRAITHCTTWSLLHQELSRVKQLLVSDSYTLSDIDKEIRRQLHKHFLTSTEREPQTNTQRVDDSAQRDISYFYQDMSTGYKADEKALRDIISRNFTPVTPTDQIKLIIYYRSSKVSYLVMCSNMSKDH